MELSPTSPCDPIDCQQIFEVLRSVRPAGCPPSPVGNVALFLKDSLDSGGFKCRRFERSRDLFRDKVYIFLEKSLVVPMRREPPVYWFGCVYNADDLAWLDFKRGRGRTVEQRAGEPVPIEDASVSTDEPDLLDAICHAEDLAVIGPFLEQFLSRLEPRERKIFMDHQSGIRPKFIAEILGISLQDCIRDLRSANAQVQRQAAYVRQCQGFNDY